MKQVILATTFFLCFFTVQAETKSFSCDPTEQMGCIEIRMPVKCTYGKIEVEDTNKCYALGLLVLELCSSLETKSTVQVDFSKLDCQSTYTAE